MITELPLFYDFGPFRLDTAQHLLLREGAMVALTPKALETLLVLVRNHGRVVEKGELLKHVWPDTFVEEATLSQNVFTLRKILGGKAGSVDEYIQAVPKRGYRFVANVKEQGNAARMMAVGTTMQPAGEDQAVAIAPAITSLAVLPILDVSAEPSAKHLVDGLAEKIVNGLSAIPDLQVRACSTLVRYKRREIDPQKVGRKLRVEAILIGRVSKNGEDVTIRIELVDVRNGWQLWGECYQEKFSNIFSAQEGLARNISEQLRATLRTV